MDSAAEHDLAGDEKIIPGAAQFEAKPLGIAGGNQHLGIVRGAQHGENLDQLSALRGSLLFLDLAQLATEFPLGKGGTRFRPRRFSEQLGVP